MCLSDAMATAKTPTGTHLLGSDGRRPYAQALIRAVPPVAPDVGGCDIAPQVVGTTNGMSCIDAEVGGRVNTIAANPLLESLACAWVQVPALAAARRLLVDGLGLVEINSGRVGHDEAPVQAGARWLLLGDVDEAYGRICLVEGLGRTDEFGLPRGLDSVEVVVAHVDLVAARLDALPEAVRVGKTLTADLTELGGNQHRSALWRMPWGTHLIVTAGLTEANGREFPRTGSRAGRVFEVHLRTDRHAAALDLYAEAMAMPVLMAAQWATGPIHDAWGLQPGSPVTMNLLKTGGEGTGAGAVELQGHATGALQRGTAGGTCGLTFHVANLEAVHHSMRSRGFSPTSPAPRRSGPHRGRVAFTLAGVEGEWLEFLAVGRTDLG